MSTQANKNPQELSKCCVFSSLQLCILILNIKCFGIIQLNIMQVNTSLISLGVTGIRFKQKYVPLKCFSSCTTAFPH